VVLRGRLKRLEGLYAIGEEPAIEPPDLEERRARLRETWQSAKEQATREALETGDMRRLRALEELEQTFKARVESRRRANLEKGA
jgi:hypothetical protein